MIEMNKLLATERNLLQRLAGISKMDKVRNINKRNYGSRKPDTTHTIEQK
jgi:hypothetical protein